MATASFRNREAVIQAILRRERDGLPLNCEAVRGVSRPLHSGAIRHFGSWRNALQAAGIDAATVERRREWDRAKIIARLREICGQRRSLRQADVHRYDSGFCRAVYLNFGSWCNALVAAGINPESICRDPQWDRNSIIEAILLRVLRSEALGSTTVRPYTLKSAAVREFGSWSAAWPPPAWSQQITFAKGRSPRRKGRMAAGTRSGFGKPSSSAMHWGCRSMAMPSCAMIGRCSLRGGHGSKIGPRHWRMQDLTRPRSMTTRTDCRAQDGYRRGWF